MKGRVRKGSRTKDKRDKKRKNKRMREREREREREKESRNATQEHRLGKKANNSPLPVGAGIVLLLKEGRSFALQYRSATTTRASRVQVSMSFLM